MSFQLIDYYTNKPRNEWEVACERIPSLEYYKFGSIRGRAVCLLKVGQHGVGVCFKPIYYVACGAITGFASLMMQATSIRHHPLAKDMQRIPLSRLANQFLMTALVAMAGQIFLIFKATMGVLNPGLYFREDTLHPYFIQLADIAQKAGAEPKFVDILKQGSELIGKTKRIEADQWRYYEALYQKELEIIIDKLKNSALPDAEKLAVLDMLAPIPGEEHTGIEACLPGLGRLLTRIHACLDLPKDPEKAIPAFAIQFKESILYQLISNGKTVGMGGYATKPQNSTFDPNAPTIDGNHFVDLIIVQMGKELGFPDDLMAEKADKDQLSTNWLLQDDEKKEILDQFHQLHTEKAFLTYLTERINSQPDGSAGLKDLRDAIIKKLIETLPDDKIASSRKEVESRFGISNTLSDDPAFTVKLLYFLHPDVSSSDERSTDLNEDGIKTLLTS